MSIKDFILNGGLFGVLRNFDHNREGRPYGFSELSEDTDAALSISKKITRDGADLITGCRCPVMDNYLVDKEMNDE